MSLLLSPITEKLNSIVQQWNDFWNIERNTDYLTMRATENSFKVL